MSEIARLGEEFQDLGAQTWKPLPCEAGVPCQSAGLRVSRSAAASVPCWHSWQGTEDEPALERCHPCGRPVTWCRPGCYGIWGGNQFMNSLCCSAFEARHAVQVDAAQSGHRHPAFKHETNLPFSTSASALLNIFFTFCEKKN